RSGEPELILNDFAVAYTKLVSKLPLSVYLGYREQPYGKVADRLRDRDVRRVGLEYNYCSKRDYGILRAATQDIEFIDAWSMLEEVRWIKTPSEIQLLKEAADLLDEVYLEVLPTIRPGEQEREVHARMMRGCIDKGFSWTHGI